VPLHCRLSWLALQQSDGCAWSPLAVPFIGADAWSQADN
jgi:hypothetical protein